MLEPLDNCHHILTTPGASGRGLTTIFALAVTKQELPSTVQQIVGPSSIVYASDKALVVAAPSQDLWVLGSQTDLQVSTDVHWFDLSGLDVGLRASGRVLGLLQDSFSLDVRGDQLRVATTLGTVAAIQGWGGSAEARASLMSQITLFNAAAGALVPAGIVTGIAPGERIWSARFTDERAYLVTFPDPLRVVMRDPLWVVDLGGVTPTILGQLEIPGVSTYIHPVDDKTLLSIGYGPGPNDNGLDRNKIQINLFDISDLTAPKRASVLDLGPDEGRTWSAAAAEHKAFTYWADAGLLAVPASWFEETTDQQGNIRNTNHVGLELVTVDGGKMTLSLRGSIDQDALAGENGGGSEILRSYFQGFPNVGVASVYAVSDLGVTVHDLRTLSYQDGVAFQ